MLNILYRKFSGKILLETERPDKFRMFAKYKCIYAVKCIDDRAQCPVDVQYSAGVFNKQQFVFLLRPMERGHSGTSIVRRFLELSRCFHRYYISLLYIGLSPIFPLCLRSFRSVDQKHYGLGIDTTDQPHRSGSSYHGCHSFRISDDWWNGRVFSRLQRRCSNGHRSEFDEPRKRDRIAAALQGETAVGADTEKHRCIHRFYPRAGAHAFLSRGNRSENRVFADDDRFCSYRRGNFNLEFSNFAATIPLQVMAGILNPFSNLNSC